jgi:glycosyltransferase involved in cell wall biosynthesis
MKSRWLQTNTLPAKLSSRLSRLPEYSFEFLLFQGPRAYRAALQKKRYNQQCARLVTQGAQEVNAFAPHTEAIQLDRPALQEYPRILYVTGVQDRFSKRYRAENIREQLQKKSIVVELINEVDIFRQIKRGLDYDAIVFQRVIADPGTRLLCSLARERGIALVFDIDDYLVFDESLIVSHYMKNATRVQIDTATAQITSLRELLLMCNYFIGTTETLCKAAEKAGLKSYTIRNGLNDRQVLLADRALRRKGQRHGEGWVRIGYQPGTRTHQQDFAVALPALGQILDEFPQVKFVIQGSLELPEALQRFQQRIDRWPFASWQKLVDMTAHLDIVIAPLERNIICEAKSALKYFEPGLVAVPVVASPTEDFQRAIQSGVNGFLAANDEEWYESLRSLVSDPVLRRQVGQKAREDVLAHYTSEAQSTDTLAVFHSMLNDWNKTRPGRLDHTH